MAAIVITAVLAVPAMQVPNTASTVARAETALQSQSYIVTTTGEFASVVRRDLGLWDSSIELTSHRFAGRFTDEELHEIRADSRVERVDVNGVVSNQATQTDGPSGFLYPNDRIPWGLDRLDSRALAFDGSYSYDTDGTGVTVYVVDSGVRATHVEFAGRIDVNVGWDYRENPTALSSYLALAPADRECGPAAESAGAADKGMTDQQGHGTHVAAVVAGARTGVAKGAALVPVRALDCKGGGTYTMVEEALKWIVAHHVSGPAVVNLSLGVSPNADNNFNPLSPAIEAQLEALVADGVSVVVAAGNSAANSCLTMPVRYEASIPGVIGVAASGWDDEEAAFSNYGNCIDVYAPGVDILSAYNTSDSSYNELSGTSMAAPHVAGVVARMLQGSSLTPTEVDDLITSTATRCAIAPFDDYPATSPNRLLNGSGESTPVSAPCAPRIGGGSLGNRSATVVWSAPADNGGSPVTGYRVTTSPSSSGCITTAPTTSCSLTGLSAGQRYLFFVQATNNVGTSRVSVARNGMPTGTPDAPTLVSATTELTTITTTLTAALGSANTYTVTAAPDGGSCSTTATSCTITGLSSGTTYTLTAVTVNSAGTSLPSASLTATTAQVPSVPVLSSSAIGINSVTLSWAATANTVSYRVKNSAGEIVCTTITQTSCTISGLVGGIEQTFTIESVNAFGATASQQVTVTPDAQVGAVPAVKVKAADRSLVVSWLTAEGNNVTYTARALGTTRTCVTTTTRCTLTGLANGRAYNVVVVGANTSSQSQSATAVAAHAGFTVKATKVKRSRRTLLTAFVVPVSNGTRKWSTTGSCRISGRHLISPAKKGTCTLTLRTAKTKKFPATTIKVRISVT